jgi:NAD(P)-dependent dehydrogenase (short-subunit alcohol dehydrogenase family)
MNTKADSAIELKDPRKVYPQPPFNEQDLIQPPGTLEEMHPRPDHGEESYHGTGKLRGLTSVITGGDSGIGRAIAIAYAREGANVVISYLNETADAEETAGWVREAGVGALTVRGDLQNEELCNSLIEKSLNEFGRLDVLINNAAFQTTEDDLSDFSTDLFDRVFKTNVYATFWLCRAALEKMSPGGSIINTVSIQGFSPSPELLPYATSKSALIGMTKGLAKLAIEHGVRVNAVAPGPVWTPLIPSTVAFEKMRNFGDNTLFKRPAQPVELAPLYVWLASPDASYVTAEVFGATGGRTPV